MGAVADTGSGEIRYAKSGGVNVAYRVDGGGPVDAVFNGGWVTHLDVWHEDPNIARFAGALWRFTPAPPRR